MGVLYIEYGTVSIDCGLKKHAVFCCIVSYVVREYYNNYLTRVKLHTIPEVVLEALSVDYW